MLGKIKWFSEEKGYGFITPVIGSVILGCEEAGGDVFIHHTGIIDQSRALKSGDEVSFDVEKSERGLKAVQVKIHNKEKT